MPERLFHPEYRRTFRFGAVGLRPGLTEFEVDQALAAILGDTDAAAAGYEAGL